MKIDYPDMKTRIGKSRNSEPFDLETQVRVIFYDLIKSYDLRLVRESESMVILSNNHIEINIGCYVGEVDVKMLLKGHDRPVLSLLWAYIVKGLDYKQISPVYPDPHANLDVLAVHRLCNEKAYLSLFCSDLLSSDFSRVDEYFTKSESMLLDINRYFAKKRNSNN